MSRSTKVTRPIWARVSNPPVTEYYYLKKEDGVLVTIAIAT